MKNSLIICLTFLCAIAASGQGSFVLWDETLNGQLSRGANPTSLDPVQIGMNTIYASVDFVPSGEGPGGALYSDFFTITVPSGTQISDLQLTVHRPIAVWIGDSGYSTELGSVINPSSGSLFTQMSINHISQGVYGFYVSNEDYGSVPSTVDYRLDFFVTVPEPSTVALGSIGLLGLLAFRRLRSRNNT